MTSYTFVAWLQMKKDKVRKQKFAHNSELIPDLPGS